MITVAILINGRPIYARSAVNISDPESISADGVCKYRIDTGEIIKHKRSDGAIKLAKKMLDTIKE